MWGPYVVSNRKSQLNSHTDLLICSSLLILSSSCTMRMTLQRLRAASSSPAIQTQLRLLLLHPARTTVRLLLAWQLPQSLRKHWHHAVRGRGRHFRLLTRPSTWEQPLQHLVCVGKQCHLIICRSIFYFLSASNSSLFPNRIFFLLFFFPPECACMLPKILAAVLLCSLAASWSVFTPQSVLIFLTALPQSHLARYLYVDSFLSFKTKSFSPIRLLQPQKLVFEVTSQCLLLTVWPLHCPHMMRRRRLKQPPWPPPLWR